MGANGTADIVDRRMRVNVMGELRSLAKAADLAALHDTELGDDVLDYAEGGVRNPALTDQEHEAALNVAAAIRPILEKAFLLKRARIGGKVVHGLDAEDLEALGWFETVQPRASEAWDLFRRRGWMNEDDR